MTMHLSKIKSAKMRVDYATETIFPAAQINAIRLASTGPFFTWNHALMFYCLIQVIIRLPHYPQPTEQNYHHWTGRYYYFCLTARFSQRLSRS